ncbi:MAG: hypothetical protein QOH12_1548 [Solirubrobacteraceae bacterium]|jgi:ferritin-like metal-binding protein YciE|nr:hypothetical protein [Solirubrobacteraceae bacterium]
MNQSEQKIVQYLGEAHASEAGLTRVLEAQIGMTPRGSFRDLLEGHLTETRDHADRVRARIVEIAGNGGFNPLSLGISVAETLISQVIAIGKTPIDLLRGSGGEEKLLKNAKDDCAAESLEIATYIALDALAKSVGDDATAKLARSILADEERMLDALRAELPRLVEAVAAASLRGDPSYDFRTTGAADAVRTAAESVGKTVDDGVQKGKKAARQARRVPGVAQAEGEVKGALADEDDLAIAGYDGMTGAEITDRLTGLSQVDLAKIDAYERKHENRTTVLGRIQALSGSEPWPGYDDQTAGEIVKVLNGSQDAETTTAVRKYEHAHKDRATVIRATERELARSGR